MSFFIPRMLILLPPSSSRVLAAFYTRNFMEKFPDMKPPSLQFDASTPGAIVPASQVANVSAHNRQNDTCFNKSRNRRILHLLLDSHAKSSLNIAEEHVERNSQNDDFHSNKSMSSMVISVLVDPKEVGDGDVDGMIKPKSLSRIFVVVLIDSVKYVTFKDAN